MSELQNFLIKNGELICYFGNAAHIVIPEGVNRIGMGGIYRKRKCKKCDPTELFDLDRTICLRSLCEFEKYYNSCERNVYR